MSRTEARTTRLPAGAALAALVLMATMAPVGAEAAESYGNCVGFIDTLPATLTTQGVWCLRKDLSSALASGSSIQVQANNITIDCNGFKVGGLNAGPGTAAYGISASNRQNVRVRRCNVRGFAIGLVMTGGRGSIVESNRFDGNTYTSIYLAGDGGAIRRNLVVDTGGGTFSSGTRRDAVVALGRIDVQDNTVSGVFPSNLADNGVIGIYLTDGIAAGNRISGLQSAFSAVGISGNGSISGIVADNFVSGVGGWGIQCVGSTTIARGNTVNGFTNGVTTCSDGGGNVHRP